MWNTTVSTYEHVFQLVGILNAKLPQLLNRYEFQFGYLYTIQINYTDLILSLEELNVQISTLKDSTIANYKELLNTHGNGEHPELLNFTIREI